jgi:hypothetical protein
MIDYEGIIDFLNYTIRQALPKPYPIVEQANTDEQPPYPFGTYTITSPYLNVKRYRVGDEVIEDVEIVVSYTWISQSSFESVQLAQMAATLLNSTKAKQKLRDAGIVVVSTMGLGSRDNFISIEVERRNGFDVKLRVRHSDVSQYEDVETIVIQGG